MPNHKVPRVSSGAPSLLLRKGFTIGQTSQRVWISVFGDDLLLHKIELATRRSQPFEPRRRLGRVAMRQLACYFRNPRQTPDLPLRESGPVYTAHHTRCMYFLKSIPVGKTRNYHQEAAAAGHRCARAAGQANRRNLFPIIIPCHRIIAADGSLGGFMGSAGAPNDAARALKTALLAHELAVGGSA